MPRSNIWIILIVIASMLGVWYFGHVYQVSRPEQAAAVADVPEIPTAETPRTPADTRKVQAQQELLLLQAELTQKTRESDGLKQALTQLQQQQAALAGSSALNSQQSLQRSSQIQAHELALQNILDDLGSFRQAESEINQSAAVALRNQDSQAALARAEIDANIQNLEQEIYNTQNELQYWRSAPIGAEVIQQPAQIRRLEDLLNQQKEQLYNLRAQRVGVSATVLNNTQMIQSLAEQAKDDLRRSALERREEIYSLRSTIERLSRAQLQDRGQLQNLRLQISGAQKNLETNNQELRRLQDAIKEKQSAISTQ